MAWRHTWHHGDYIAAAAAASTILALVGAYVGYLLARAHAARAKIDGMFLRLGQSLINVGAVVTEDHLLMMNGRSPNYGRFQSLSSEMQAALNAILYAFGEPLRNELGVIIDAFMREAQRPINDLEADMERELPPRPTPPFGAAEGEAYVQAARNFHSSFQSQLDVDLQVALRNIRRIADREKAAAYKALPWIVKLLGRYA